jgi:LytS/YehU family sensor histidine kinase
MPHVATNVTTSMFVVLGAFYFAHAIMGWVVKGFITWFKEYKLKQELTLANQNMELALLKSKMDPHFLFNTLNNLDALILTDPPRASEYLNKLSDILRFIVHQTDNHRIQIQSEIDYLNKYIDLQLLRSSNSNLVVRKFSSFESSKLTIAPVTFIPFVENAFKHGVLQNESIVVDIKPIDNGIVFTCTNKVGPKSVIENSPSIGNALIKQRLQSIYGNKHQLTFENASSQYRVNLTIHA